MPALGQESWKTSRLVVLGPAAILSAIFIVTILTSFTASGDAGSAPWATALGSACFILAVILLTRAGLKQIVRLEQLSLTDTLTGLRNRHAFHVDFRRFERASEEMAIALIDLDGFMLVNEHYGHAVGDRSICECGRIILDVCGAEATVYRLGGDEFALLKTGSLAATLLEGLCHRIVERLIRPVQVDERRLTLGASIGLARRSVGETLTSSELLRRADVAMYSSKRSGKARCTWYSPDFDAARERARKLDDELRLALTNEEFTLHYQPLIDCHTSQVAAVEALIRWNRPDGTDIGPSIFIPVAEESGLINAIGLWVIRKACTDAQQWEGIKLSVNISPVQLRNPEFPIQLGHILEETGFAPEQLELEITETCLVLDPVVAERSLAVIHDFGVNVVLDDFGTGYASFGFLRRFCFEKLKIDRSLVAQAVEDPGSRAMILSSIAVARAMNMTVTAEGVETAEQVEMVKAAGCDQIQGWFYFAGMPAEEVSQHFGLTIGGPTVYAIDSAQRRVAG
ncbi:putative bifunctional diguanylate cyclase/phosphodiesterase [Qipengyuania sp.]|uniref:putative bifunctional diguanylate cyclase/phosphodiesterase n=1 Tax=Qipengyuania sp. TaxID=2004515 RepID=UPI0035C87A2E